MKINVLGGGPAGLYFSILAKKQDPAREVVVWERNAPDDTFGWGVVFSDETLGNLRGADEPTYDAIRQNFAYWDHIDLHTWTEGEHRVQRTGGHGFCGIGRMRLLLLLQQRARELGVELRFRSEVDVDALRSGDLVVAADGINSRTRERYEEAFQPTIEHGDARFIWLGTKQTFDAFTFSFRQNEHGVFQVHAYQFDRETSTFIVECDQASWRAAGLDTMSEAQSIAYCERLFHDELGGKPLLGNRSSWIHFRTIKCAKWYHENIALMGDAVHTAHFSVGSGTKLAMEDAIALVDALGSEPTVAAALPRYQAIREDQMARTQKAAAQSQRWFEEVKRHIKLPPERLNFSMLTRSRRITHENMRVRDPGYIEHLDRWYMREQGLDGSGVIVPPLFTPFRLRGMELKNRIVVSPMCQYSADDGVPNDWHLVHLGSRAIGGAGLVYAEMTDVSPEGRITPKCAGIWNDEQAQSWKRIVDFVHARSPAKMALQLGHAGRKGSTKVLWEGYDQPLQSGGWELLAPSAIPWAKGNRVPKAMDRADMDMVREQHVAAARRASLAGFDMIELHMAHGYLLSSFITPLSNHRSDEYGGSLENRARFPLEVLRAVREVWKGPLSVRISATDWVPGGLDIEQAVDLSWMLKEGGVDIIDVSTGQTSTESKPVYGRAYQTPFAERIRNDVGIPTMTVGNIYDHDRINTILVAGRADLVALARAHLADPYVALHAAGQLDYTGAGVMWPPQYRSADPILRRMFSGLGEE